MANLALTDVKKSFGKVDVIKGVSLDIAHGEFIVFVGPSGCGKSTLLRLIAGLEDISSGTIQIGDKVVNELPPKDRSIAMVFQSYALFPHMTVRENVGFGLKLAGTPQAEMDAKVAEAARMLKLEQLLDRKPAQLSGGQRQRVAIGRAIVRKPDVFLFDEPLSNLDAALRVNTRAEIAKLHRDLGATMIYVTHDQVEAMTLADRIAVLDAGELHQFGAPLELYHHPQNKFVAGFIGSPKMNFIPVACETSSAKSAKVSGSDLSAMAVPVDGAALAKGEKLELGVRPEDMALATGRSARVKGKVTLVERLGHQTYIEIETADRTAVTALVDGAADIDVGDSIGLGFAPETCHLFNSAGLACRRLAAPQVKAKMAK